MADADPRLPGTGSAELQRLFDRQHAASRGEPPAPLKLRLDRLGRLADVVRTSGDRLADAISADFGTRARIETELMELVPTLGAIRHAKKNLARWMKPERRRVGLNFQPGKAWVRHEPLGVVGIISPWNYPLQLAFSPAIDAIAAGNRVLLKPSELTPPSPTCSSNSSPRPSTRPNWRWSPAVSRSAAPSPHCRSTTCCSPVPPRSAGRSTRRPPRTLSR